TLVKVFVVRAARIGTMLSSGLSLPEETMDATDTAGAWESAKPATAAAAKTPAWPNFALSAADANCTRAIVAPKTNDVFRLKALPTSIASGVSWRRFLNASKPPYALAVSPAPIRQSFNAENACRLVAVSTTASRISVPIEESTAPATAGREI